MAARRLERLLAAGLLTASFGRRSGRSGPGAGRPAKLYRAVSGPKPVAARQGGLAKLLGRLVRELPTRGRPERLRRVGAEFGGELASALRMRPARSLGSGLTQLVRGARRCGFEVAIVDQDASSAVLSTRDCPLRPTVRAQMEAVELDRGMWAALVVASCSLGSTTDVVCETTHCLDEGACLIRVGLAPRAA